MTRGGAACEPAYARSFATLAAWLKSPIHEPGRRLEGWLRASIKPLLIIYVCAVALAAATLFISSRNESIASAIAGLEALCERATLRIELELARARAAHRALATTRRRSGDHGA